MKAVIIGLGIVLAICGAVLLWDKCKKDCERDGVCKFDGQE